MKRSLKTRTHGVARQSLQVLTCTMLGLVQMDWEEEAPPPKPPRERPQPVEVGFGSCLGGSSPMRLPNLGDHSATQSVALFRDRIRTELRPPPVAQREIVPSEQLFLDSEYHRQRTRMQTHMRELRAELKHEQTKRRYALQRSRKDRLRTPQLMPIGQSSSTDGNPLQDESCVPCSSHSTLQVSMSEPELPHRQRERDRFVEQGDASPAGSDKRTRLPHKRQRRSVQARGHNWSLPAIKPVDVQQFDPGAMQRNPLGVQMAMCWQPPRKSRG